MAFRAGCFGRACDTTPMLVGGGAVWVILAHWRSAPGCRPGGAGFVGVVFAGSSQFVAVSLMVAGLRCR